MDSLCCTPGANTTLQINYTPIKNFFFKYHYIKHKFGVLCCVRFAARNGVLANTGWGEGRARVSKTSIKFSIILNVGFSWLGMLLVADFEKLP